MYNALHINKQKNSNCFPYYNNTETCDIKNEPKCKYAVGSMQMALQKPGILPDIQENKPSIAYSNACFLPNNYTIYGNATRIDNNHRTRREVTLAVVFLISIVIGALIAGIIEAQMKTYNDRINDKLEKLETKFTSQLNQVEDQVSQLQKQQIELTKAIAQLSRITANIAIRQQRFETYVLAFNRQLLQRQIIIARRSIENRKLILSRNARVTQRAIQEYNSRKLILQTLKRLQTIPALRNDTVYQNQIQNGIIQNTEIYRIIKSDQQNLTKWIKKHPLIKTNQSNRLQQFDTMQQALEKENTFLKDIQILQGITNITIKPIQHIDFTNTYEPIPFPGIDVGEGISGVINTLGEAGNKILDTGSNLIKDVVQTGANLISKPLQIIIIAACILGGLIILLISYKFVNKTKIRTGHINFIKMNLGTSHIWKEYDEYHARREKSQDFQHPLERRQGKRCI